MSIHHHHYHYQVNYRSGVYIQNPAPLNPHTYSVDVVSPLSLGYFYAYDNSYVVSDTRYGHIDHNPQSYVPPWSINLNRGASVVPSRRGRNNEPHGTFRRQTTNTEVGQIPQGRNSRESDESPSRFMHSNWSREEETMILHGIHQVVGSSGDTNAGVSEEVVSKYLRTRNCDRMIRAAAKDEEAEICVVYQDDLSDENQTIAALECGHKFHTPCIKTWLIRKNACPLCKSIALPYR